jgi:hypothetical protein
MEYGADDFVTLGRSVRNAAETSDLEAAITARLGWCAVRFSRRNRTSG